jgi:hypothetical protein
VGAHQGVQAALAKEQLLQHAQEQAPVVLTAGGGMVRVMSRKALGKSNTRDITSNVQMH